MPATRVACLSPIAAFTLVVLACTSAHAGPLADAAEAVQPGEWAEIQTNGLTADLLDDGGGHHILQFTDDARWDSNQGAILFTGAGHASGIGRFIRYDEAGDQWTQLANNPSNWVGHAYDHSGFDAERGLFFHRVHSSRAVHQYDTAAGTWSSLPSIPEQVLQLEECCGALEYFPDMNSVVFFDGNWGVVSMDLDDQEWVFLGNPDMGSIHNFAEYSPGAGAVVFGGGNDSSNIYRLDADGSITQVSSAPLSQLRIGVQVITVDPNSGVLLAFDSDASYEFDIEQDEWAQFEAPPFVDVGDEGAFGAAAAPVDSYGVVFVMKRAGAGGRTWVYRHSPGSGTPPTTTGGSGDETGMDDGAADGDSSDGASDAGTSGSSATSGGLTSGAQDDGNTTASDGDSSASGEPGGTGTATAGSSAGGEDPPEGDGCGCSSGGRTAGLLLLPWLVVLATRRRRPVGALVVASALTLPSLASATPDEDFSARASHPDVVFAEGFDSVEAVEAKRHPDGREDRVTFTAEEAASGAGSIQFEVPSNSSANNGSWKTNFADDNYSIKFRSGDDLYVQWRQRFSAEYLATVFNTEDGGAGGWKQIIIGEGDYEGWDYGQAGETSSCTPLEIVVNNGGQRAFPQMYHNCGDYWPYSEPFESEFNANDFLLQNAVYDDRGANDAERYVLWSQLPTRSTTVPATFPGAAYAPDEWMTFQVRISPGPLGIAVDPLLGTEAWGFTDSTVQMWVARQGEPSVLTHSFEGVVLQRGDGIEETDEAYGKLWLTTQHTNKDASQTHPTGYTWYDELIVSSSRIADPGFTPPDGGGTTSGDTTGGDDEGGSMGTAGGATDAGGDSTGPANATDWGPGEDTGAGEPGSGAPETGASEGGCACAVRSSGAPAGGLVCMLLLGARRRRRAG